MPTYIYENSFNSNNNFVSLSLKQQLCRLAHDDDKYDKSLGSAYTAMNSTTLGSYIAPTCHVSTPS